MSTYVDFEKIAAPSDDVPLSQGRIFSRADDARAPAPLLQLNNISKSYESAAAVSNATLSLQPGEVFTLLGPSGCGKTTLLRIAIGLERTSTGTVQLGGRLVDSPAERIFMPPERRDMGMVFQSYAIWPHLSVFENVAYPLRARRRSSVEIRERVAKVLDLVGMAHLADRPSTKLSGGQQQRVAIARALAFGPSLLLMDEPFSNLDASLRAQMRREVKLLQRQLGIAILFVTHDQSEALALSDRIAVMDTGRIEQIGSPKQLYASPSTPKVRDFLGQTVLLPGRIVGREFPNKVIVDLNGIGVCAVTGADHTDPRADSRCLVAFRPEDISIEAQRRKAAGVTTELNVLSGEILALLFMGSFYEASVRLASGQIITVTLPPTLACSEKDSVRLNLAPSSLQLWPTEEPLP